MGPFLNPKQPENYMYQLFRTQSVKWVQLLRRHSMFLVKLIIKCSSIKPYWANRKDGICELGNGELVQWIFESIKFKSSEKHDIFGTYSRTLIQKNGRLQDFQVQFALFSTSLEIHEKQTPNEFRIYVKKLLWKPISVQPDHLVQMNHF